MKYDLCKQKRKQSIKVDDDIRQIMYALIDYWYNVDEEDITTDGHLIFMNNHYEETVEFCGKDGEYYHFVTSGYYNEYDEFDYFIKIENGVAYTYEDGVVHSLVICLNKEENNDFCIKNGTKHIYDSAFKNCKFNNVIVPDSVGYVSKDNFLPSSVQKITLKSRRTTVYDKEDKTFMKIINFEKSELERLIKEDGSLVIPNNIIEIPAYAFRGCKSLTSVVIPDCITSIGSYAFEDCTSLKRIVIPNSVTKIESSAFYGCSSLISIIIPDNDNN